MTTMRDHKRQVDDFLNRHLTRGVKWLVLSNVVIFVFQFFVVYTFRFEEWWAWLLAQNPIVDFQPTPDGTMAIKFNWLCTTQFFTYMFLHADLFHLFGNMLALWFFGPPLEQRWGTTAFLKFYLSVGFAAGLLHGLVAPFIPGEGLAPMIGASGAVFGVILVFAIYYPEQKVLLWFVVPISARVLAILMGIFTLYAMIGGRDPQVSHLTHLAGIGFGYLWIRVGERFPYFWLFSNDPGPFARGGPRGKGGGRFDGEFG